jgi:hypothetical protein
MNDRYLDSMAYLLVDSVTGNSRRNIKRSGSETMIRVLGKAQGRSVKQRSGRSRWEDLWRNLFRSRNINN